MMVTDNNGNEQCCQEFIDAFENGKITFREDGDINFESENGVVTLSECPFCHHGKEMVEEGEETVYDDDSEDDFDEDDYDEDSDSYDEDSEEIQPETSLREKFSVKLKLDIILHAPNKDRALEIVKENFAQILRDLKWENFDFVSVD